MTSAAKRRRLVRAYYMEVARRESASMRQTAVHILSKANKIRMAARRGKTEEEPASDFIDPEDSVRSW